MKSLCQNVGKLSVVNINSPDRKDGVPDSEPPRDQESKCTAMSSMSNPNFGSTTVFTSTEKIELPNVANGDDIVDASELLLLPTELLLKIISFLDAHFAVDVLQHVCKLFNALVKDKYTWKSRVVNQLKNSYPFLSDLEIDWAQACAEIEQHKRMWRNGGKDLHHFSLTKGHFASIVSMVLTENGRICFSGSKDRHVKVWNFSQLATEHDPEPTLSLGKPSAHEGWVSSLAFHDCLLSSASWDHTVKLWDMSANGKQVGEIRTDSFFYCTQFVQDTLVVGSSNHLINLYDVRVSYKEVHSLKHHSKAVICLSADDNYIISSSPDKTLVIYDRVAAKVLHRIRTFNMKNEHLYSLKHSLGYLYLCYPNSIEVCFPTNPLTKLFTIHSTMMSTMSTRTNLLAAGCHEGALDVWVPLNHFSS
uniref:F-box/WD repeat-containing protein 9-like isoform X2 n=1 Tax=Myxine glutinosa TaxID=7769 RepID=UPI00358F3650